MCCRPVRDHSLTSSSTADVDIRVRVRGGGHTSQVYAIRQAIAKSIVRPPTTSIAAKKPSTNLPSIDRLLPEVRRRAQQEPAQASPRCLRPHPPRRRQPPHGAQEVRRSRCPCQVPEVLPIKACVQESFRRTDGWAAYDCCSIWDMH